ncbi:MAG: protein kinase [Vicinamibacteria bacterium]
MDEASTRDSQEIEIIARTLAIEHEAAEKGKIRVFVDSLTKSDASEKPRAFALPEPHEDRGEIARGGMGAVRRAFDLDLKRQVAIKVMLPTLSGEESVSRRFIDEARITALIDHPNIAPVYRLAKAPDGALSLVMKLIDGQSFTSHLRALPPPPWSWSVLDSLLSIFVKVCDAVAFAHSRGVIHLDLKPDNIMLGPFGQVYVVDWGIARYRPASGPQEKLETLSPRDASTGTPAYMSPEQALRIEPHIGEATDVFLLGGILYEILTGRRPHEGKTMVEVLTSAIRGAVIPPAQRAPYRMIHPALAAIAMKALAARPQDRHPSVLDLQAEVVTFQRGEERAPRRTYEAGAIVIKEGEPGDEAFVIVSGKCLVTATSGGKRVVLRELGPGDVFGETAVFSDEPRSATVEAAERTELRVVTGETLSLSLGLETWTGEFVKALAERFREADRRNRQKG